MKLYKIEIWRCTKQCQSTGHCDGLLGGKCHYDIMPSCPDPEKRQGIAVYKYVKKTQAELDKDKYGF